MSIQKARSCYDTDTRMSELSASFIQHHHIVAEVIAKRAALCETSRALLDSSYRLLRRINRHAATDPD